jgi:hypothetical protein
MRTGIQAKMSKTTSASIQRQSASARLQAEVDNPQDIQTQMENATRFGHSLSNIPIQPERVNSAESGRPLTEQVRRKMEAAFGHDLSDVRVQEDVQAPALGAAAYTRGSEIHFTPGLYQPHSAEGQTMIGHELAHVVQQKIGRVNPTSAKGINAEPALENEADAAGTKAAQGNQINIASSHANASVGGPVVQMLSLSALKPSDERKKALKKYGLNLLSTGASGAGSVLSSVLGAALKGGSSGDIFNAFKESGTKAAGTLGKSALSGFQGVLHPGQADANKSDAVTSDASTASTTTATDATTAAKATTADTSQDTGTAASDTTSATSTSDTKTAAGGSNADSKIEELKPWKPALQQIIKIIDS